MTRRQILLAGAGALALFSVWRLASHRSAATTGESFETVHSDAEWRRLLTPAQYAVLREHETERPYSSPLNSEKRSGVFACAGCDLPLFSSAAKYESGTGWPSFWQPLDNAIGTAEDTSFWMARTELHCRRCGGHLGHVFNDGPQPTGLRYCINGAAMTFEPTVA